MPRYAEKQGGRENILFLSHGNYPEINPHFCHFFQNGE